MWRNSSPATAAAQMSVPYTFPKVPDVQESPRATASRVQEVCQDNPDTMKAHSSQNEPNGQKNPSERVE